MKVKPLRSTTVTLQSTSIFFIALFFLLPRMTAAQLVDRVVAVVNDDIITLSEMEESGSEFLNMVREKTPKASRDQALMRARENVLDKLINQHLISQKAAQANISLSDNEFKMGYEKNFEGMNLSREQFLEQLKESGLTEENYKDSMRNQFLRDKLILYEVRSKIIVTEEMMVNYYNTEFSKEIEGGGYYLLQIGFTWGKTAETTESAELLEADKERARKRVEEARQEVIDGAGFGMIAKERSELPSASDGGDLGLFQKDEMAPYMLEAVLPLKAGEISEIVETPIGYQFFKLLSSLEGEIVHQVPYESVKEEIRKKLFEITFKEEFQIWVEEIKKGSYIKKMLY
jgi:peptidyl-prolyl cis-trans isomerase SurA